MNPGESFLIAIPNDAVLKTQAVAETPIYPLAICYCGKVAPTSLPFRRIACVCIKDDAKSYKTCSISTHPVRRDGPPAAFDGEMFHGEREGRSLSDCDSALCA